MDMYIYAYNIYVYENICNNPRRKTRSGLLHVLPDDHISTALPSLRKNSTQEILSGAAPRISAAAVL